MKKVIALFLALMMMVGCTGAMAEMDLSKGARVDINYDLNKDMFMGMIQMAAGSEAMEEMPPEVISAVMDLISAIGATASFDGETVQINLNLKDKPIVNLEGGMLQDGSLVLATNILPSHALMLDAETMNQAKAEMENAMGQFDVEKIMAAAEKLEDDFEDALEGIMKNWAAKDLVKQEKGSYVMEDVTYTQKYTVETDSNEMMVFLQDVLNAMMPLLENFVKEANLPVEEDAFAEMKRDANNFTPDENPIPVYVTVYDEAVGHDDYSFVALEMADEQAAVAVAIGLYDDNVEGSIYFGEGSYESAEDIINAAYAGQGNAMVMDLAVLQGENDEDMNAVVTMVMGGMYMGYYVETKAVDGGMDAKMEMYLMSDEAPMMTVDYKLRPLTEKLAPVSVEGKQMVNMLQLNENMDETLADALEKDISTGLSGVLINAVTAAPDEIQAVLNLAVQMQ